MTDKLKAAALETLRGQQEALRDDIEAGEIQARGLRREAKKMGGLAAEHLELVLKLKLAQEHVADTSLTVLIAALNGDNAHDAATAFAIAIAEATHLNKVHAKWHKANPEIDGDEPRDLNGFPPDSGDDLPGYLQ